MTCSLYSLSTYQTPLSQMHCKSKSFYCWSLCVCTACVNNLLGSVIYVYKLVVLGLLWDLCYETLFLHDMAAHQTLWVAILLEESSNLENKYTTEEEFSDFSYRLSKCCILRLILQLNNCLPPWLDCWNVKRHRENFKGETQYFISNGWFFTDTKTVARDRVAFVTM